MSGADFDQIDRQRLEELAGVRTAKVAGRAAVRKSDMAPIVSLAPTTATALSSGATVSAADYNALLADFQALSQAVAQIAVKVKT